MTIVKKVFLFSGLSSAILLGQESPRFTFDFGAGFTESVGATRIALDKTGYNVSGGAGVNIKHGLAVKVDVSYNDLGINGATLGAVGVPGGDVSMFTALVDPVYHVGGIHHVDFYVTGGGGLFRQNQEFTAPALTRTLYYDPFFGFYPAVGVGSQILSAYSVNKPGYDVGAGFEFGTKWHGKLFGEAKYEHMFNNNSHTDIIPVTFGFRW